MVAPATAPKLRINLFANTQRALPGYLTERQLRTGKTPLWTYPDRKPDDKANDKPAPKK